MQVASKGLMWNASFAGNGKTVLVLRADAGRMTVRLSSGSLAPGSTNVTIDWGDGMVDVLPRISGTTHTYRSERLYMVKISDDLQSFGYSYGNPSRTDFTRDMLVELKSLGSKVTRIEGYCFNNCHNMTGVMYLPNVTQIGGYAFGTTLGITDFILPSMTRLVQESFYAGPSPTQIHADNVQQIDRRFWEYYGGHLTDMYIRGKTRAQIKAMGGFPFYARGAGVRFHGSDGIVLANGTFV